MNPIRPAALLLLALLAAPVQAAVHCVDTAAEILAWANAAFDEDEVSDIRIVQGTYQLGLRIEPPTTVGHLQLRGGYLPGCNARAPNPFNTVLDFSNAGAQGALDIIGAQKITITWLTVQDARQVNLAGYNEVFDGPAVDVHNTVIRRIGPDTANDHLAPVTVNAIVGSLDFRNNLLHDLVSPGPGCGVSFGHDATVSTVVNNTFGDLATFANGVADICFVDPFVGAEPGAAAVYNNVVWSQPVQTGFWAAPGFAMTLVNNTVPYYSGPAPSFQAGTLNGNPNFVNPANDAYWLPDTSNSVNSGTTFVPGGLSDVDLTNTARHVGSAPDRGAYESNFDDTQTMLVTNTFNTGPGSLRQALLDANATVVPKQIRFQLPGNCPHVIGVPTVLPDVTVPVQILGNTQAGWAANTSDDGFDATLCVILHNQGAATPHALRVPANAADATLRVEGLAFSGFSDRAVVLLGGHDHVLAGNQFGGNMPSTPLELNHMHVFVGTGVTRYTLGGVGPAARNLFGNSSIASITSFGVWIETGANGGRIVNNVFGMARGLNGYAANRVALRLDGSSTLVRDNLIAGNTSDGLLIGGSNNTVQNNRIGLQNANGTFGNGGAGIALSGGAAGNSVGSLSLTLDPWADGNHVAHNAGGGVHVRTLAGNANLIRGNRLHDNGDLPQIDLGSAGRDVNDLGDADTGPNTRLNHPVLDTIELPLVPADATDVPAMLEGTLTTAAGSYVVDVYGGDVCDEGIGEAREHLGQVVVNLPAAGSANFSVPLTLPRVVDYALSAAATSASGSTSELGACLAVEPPAPPEPLPDEIFADGFED